MEKTLCYSELSGHTFRPDIKKSKSHALFSLLNPWSNEGCFFVTPFPGSDGGSVQPFFWQTAASLSGEQTAQPVAMPQRLPASPP